MPDALFSGRTGIERPTPPFARLFTGLDLSCGPRSHGENGLATPNGLGVVLLFGASATDQKRYYRGRRGRLSSETIGSVTVLVCGHK